LCLGASALDRIKDRIKDQIKDRIERNKNETNAIFERNIARRQGRLL